MYAPRRAVSSVGQSASLTPRKSLVRVQYRPPHSTLEIGPCWSSQSGPSLHSLPLPGRVLRDGPEDLHGLDPHLPALSATYTPPPSIATVAGKHRRPLGRKVTVALKSHERISAGSRPRTSRQRTSKKTASHDGSPSSASRSRTAAGTRARRGGSIGASRPVAGSVFEPRLRLAGSGPAHRTPSSAPRRPSRRPS